MAKATALWMDVEMDKADVMVVDCGYLADKAARDRADKLFAAGIGKSCMSIELYPHRIFIKVPASKREAITRRFRSVVAGKIHFGSTHHWRQMEGQGLERIQRAR